MKTHGKIGNGQSGQQDSVGGNDTVGAVDLDVQARFPGRQWRTVFSDHQLAGLMQRFEAQRYLSGPERVELAAALNFSETQVQPKADMIYGR